MQKSQISFYGGVGTVSGSNFLLEIPNIGNILVDCGMFQGLGSFQKNQESFVYDPGNIDILMVTHGHMDHIGRIPKLIRDGFSGRIISTRQTKEIAKIMFDDALKIMQENAKRYNNSQTLYDQANISKTLSLWETIPYHTVFEILPGVNVELLDAGHILGSAMIRIKKGKRSIVFTGDVGNSPSPIVRDADSVTGANYLILDSTYGDRTHESREKAEQRFASIVARVIEERGTLLIPAFSLERSHIILYQLNNLVEKGKIKDVPVFLDSPLASKLMSVYDSSRDLFNKSAISDMGQDNDIFSFPKLKIVKNNLESKATEWVTGPKIIIAGSGMSIGGRIPAHEINLLPDPKTTLLITGYQAFGTPGRALADGAKTVTINNIEIPMRARIETIGGFSAHKDSQALLELVEKSMETLERIFIVHGEPKSSLFLVQRVRDYLGLNAVAPEKGFNYMIDF